MRGSGRYFSATSPAELVPEDYFSPLDFAQVFGRDAPVEIDLGCGDGAFLTALAEQHPDRNFLGIERLCGRVGSASRKIVAGQLSNARILRVEISYAVERMLPAQSVEKFHLMFPDPWPKRRHQRRRIVTGELLQSIARALVTDGSVRIATDEADYFDEMQRVVRAIGRFAVDERDIELTLPVSAFEKRFQKSGTPIYRLVLRKVS